MKSYSNEYGFIIKFAKNNTDLESKMQLICLWTAYCIRRDLNIDTAEYDILIFAIWEKLLENGNCPYTQDDYDDFYNDMSQFLV